MEETVKPKMKHKELGSFEFAQTLQKVAATPTTVAKANLIRKAVQAVEKAREKMMEEYQKIIAEKFGQKNEDGSIKRPEHEPRGFTPLPGCEEELNKAHDAFGEMEVEIDGPRLTPSLISDMKVSAKDLEALKSLLAEEDGPGLPQLAPVRG